MSIKQLIEQVFLDTILTADVEEKINQLIWSNQFDAADIAALDELVNALELNRITVPNYSFFTFA